MSAQSPEPETRIQASNPKPVREGTISPEGTHIPTASETHISWLKALAKRTGIPLNKILEQHNITTE